MKKLLIIAALIAAPTVAYAACTYHTYNIDGRTVFCNTCCVGTSCTTTCN